MKSFREYLSEEVLPSALVADGSIDIEKSAVRGAINAALAGVTAQPTVTPYVSLHHISKLLAQYHIILPKRAYLEGDRGVEVYEIRQFGDRMGMTDQAEFVHSVPSKFYLFIQYSTHTPLGVTYAKPTVGGMFRMVAKLVDQNELENLVSMAEVMMKEDAEQHQKMAKAIAPKEPMHDVTSDEKKDGNKKAVAASEKKSLDEAMTRKQKDMAVRRFMSHDPDAGERILKMGKKEREEKKSFASAEKEANKWQKHRLKEDEQIDELKKSTLGSYIKKAHVSGLEAASKGEIAYARKDKEGLRAANKTGEKREQGIERAANKLAKEETLDELKKSTLASYIKKAAKNQSDHSFDHGEDEHRQYGDRGEDPDRDREVDDRERKISNRKKGIDRAADKLAKEEYEKVEAGVKKRPGETHTLHRRNPGHKTEYHTITTDRDGRKSVKTGSPKYIKKHWDKLEEEQLDELHGKGSLEKIRSYHQGEANKLSQGGRKQEKRMGALGRLHRDSEDREDAIKHHMGKAKKARGLMSKLAMREDTLDEKHLTPAETRKKEEIVMSMKKGLPGFKKRYGERAKEVMYATATKRAKQVAEKLEFDPSTEVPRNT